MERGRGGKGKGGGDHLPYFPPLASASNATLVVLERRMYYVLLTQEVRNLFKYFIGGK